MNKMRKNSGPDTQQHPLLLFFFFFKTTPTITFSLLHPMSALEFVSTFFSPTYLFLFLNLIIGTIFITSRLGSHRPSMPQPVPLARAPSSLIDRVRSINLSLYKFQTHPESHPVHHDYPGLEPEVVNGPPLVRAPSLLSRLRSVNFYQNKFEHIDPEPEPETLHLVDPPPAPLSRAPSSLLDRLKSINFYYQKFDQSGGPAQELDRSTDTPDTAPLARAPSLLERVRSINFPSFYEPDPDTEPKHDDMNHQAKDRGHGPVRRIRSESEKMGEQQGEKPRIRKTASEKSAADVGEEEEIDAKADDFIQRFRHQLRLQRLDSIMRYKDMLTGGGR